jgi:hypothetical protein
MLRSSKRLALKSVPPFASTTHVGLIQVLGAVQSSPAFQIKAIAVLCSLAESDDGSLRVVIEDIARGQESGESAHRSLFSFKDPKRRDLADLSEPELAVFGQYILMRLLVRNQIGT